MDLRRLRAGEWIVAVSGVALAATLFTPWYMHATTGNLTAWQALTVLDLLLFALAVLAVGLLVLTAVQPTAAVPIAADAMLTLLASAVAVATAARVLAPPEVAGAAVDRAAWAWVGLAAALGVLVGAVVAMRDERLSPPGERTDATGVPAPPAPEIETVPALRRRPS